MAENKEKIDRNKLEATDLDRFIFDVISELSERSRGIIIKRFNLDKKETRTLEEIGKEYKITRERVRQLEVEAIMELKNRNGKYNFEKIFDYIREIIQNHGGIISEEKIIKNLLDSEDFKLNKQTVLLILSLDDKIKTLKKTKEYKKIYFCEKENVLRFKKALKKTRDHLQEKNRGADFNEIAEIINESVEKSGFLPLSTEAIKSYLEANKIILKNILGEWGCEEWSYINPKTIKDKAYLSLKKNKKTLHFTKITDEINIIWPQKKKTNNHATVHNEIIKDDRFVLIGRGLYALKEWGYEKGTVLDIIIKIISRDNRSMEQEEIVEEVLRKREVKRNTIILNLQNKKYFEKMKGKIYRLK